MVHQNSSDKTALDITKNYTLSLLQSIINDSDDLFAAVDTQFRFIAINELFIEYFESVYGIRAKVGDNLLELLAHIPGEQKKVEAAWGRALRGEEFEFSQEYGDERLKTKFFQIKFKTLRDENKKLIGAYQLVKDRSELKDTKDRLTGSEAIIHSFLDSAPMMMGVTEIVNNDIMHIFVNSHAAVFFGSSPEEMKGKLASELGVSSSEIELWLKYYKLSEQSGLPQQFEYQHTTQKGLRTLLAVVSKIEKNRFSYIVLDISEKKVTEKELLDSKKLLEQRVLERTNRLESSQKNFERMFNLAPFAQAVVKSESGILVHVNTAWMNLTGLNASEVLGKSTKDLGLFYDPSERDNIYLEFNASGKVRNAELTIKSKTHGLRNILCSMDHIDLEGFEETDKHFVLVTMEDITERKKSEESIKLEQHRLMAVIIHSPSCLSLKSADGKYLIANPNYNRILGMNTENMIGKTDHDLYPAFIANKLRENDLLVLAGEKLSVEEVIPRSDGMLLTFNSHKFPITDLKGNIESVCSISLDITARKKAEKDLQYQLRLVQTITDNAASALFMMDKHGHPTFMNPAAKKLTGYQGLDEIKDKPLHYAIHWKKPDGSYYPMEECPIDNAQAELKPVQNQEEIFCKKDGTLFPVSYSVSPLEKDGEIIGSVLEFRDITEERDSKKSLRTYATSLEEALRARDDFLSIASHELKTPLTSLKLYAQLSKRSRDRGDESVYGKVNVDRLIDQIDKQSERLARLIEDMLDISRIRTGKLFLQLETFDLCSLFSDVIERLDAHFKDSGITVTYHCASPLNGHWDRYRMDQVLTNLLTNAMKYGNKAPVEISADLKKEDPSRIQIRVKDSGIGIEANSLERIFNQFERAISANEVSGLGLGLFITREIVEAHGGKIWAESAGLGKGSTFIVELPF